MAARASTQPKKLEPESVPIEEQSVPIEDRIRQRAYEIYLQRDGHGAAIDDWLQAETEITHTVEQNYVHREEADANA